MTESRKLAAILAADVVGYSRLAGADEDRTLARLRGLRSDLIDPAIAANHGRVVKRTGDGILIEFRSVVDAVRCAIEVQNGMVERNAGLPPERKIEFRCGIHLGDVVEESDGDLMGDGVNIAARLEGIAKPGTIYLSDDAYRQVRARLDLAVSDLGEQSLKNIALPMRVFALEVGLPAQAKTAARPRMIVPAIAAAVAVLIIAGGAWFGRDLLQHPSPPLGAAVKPPPDKAVALSSLPRGTGEGGEGAAAREDARHLSIVVLPFQNLSGDPKQDYFADGITDNLTTDLSRIRNSFVIARNTAFTYKGKNIDAKEIGKELGVRYVLEGSVARDGNRVRVNAQLIDAASGSHLWADRFEEDLADLFKLQDDVVARLANTLGYELVKAEAAKGAHSTNPDAIDLTLQGWALLNQPVRRDLNKQAEEIFERALKLAPENTGALAGAANAYARDFSYGWGEASVDYNAKIIARAERAIAGDPHSAMAYYAKGFYLADSKRSDDGLATIQTGIQNNPNAARLYDARALVETHLAMYREALSDEGRALQLSPRDPQRGVWFIFRGNAELELGLNSEAVESDRRGIEAGYRTVWSYCHLAAAYAQSNKMEEARAALSEARQIQPEVSIKWLMKRKPASPRFYEGLRKAGLPEDEAPKLSIVVLPFQNLSGDPKQDYFADGITENLTTDLSRIRNSFVIARNTAFTYKGKSIDAKEIGKELDVRYVLEGSVQRDGNRVRVNAQLIDAETGAHLWAEEFDTDKTDLLQTEDEIVTRLARTLQIQMNEIEAARFERANPGVPDAQELALRCSVIVQMSDSLDKNALAGFRLCERALELDPNNVVALATLSHQASSRVVTFQSANKDADIARADEFSARALAIEPNNAYALVSRAWVLTIRGRLAEATVATERALALSPSLIDAYVVQDVISLYRFEPAKTIESALKAMRLSPRDPEVYVFQGHMGTANFWLHRDDQAIDWLRQSIALYRSTQPTYLYLIAALALNGHEKESKEALADYLSFNPRAKTVAVIKAAAISTDPRYFTMRERLYAGLRKAGMPEK